MITRQALLGNAMRVFAEATAEPKVLLQTIAQTAAEALSAYCGFATVSADGLLLEPVATFDPDPAALDIISPLTRTSVSLDAPHPLARAMTSLTPTSFKITPELLKARFPQPADYAAALSLGLDSVLFVPLRARGVLVGGFSLARRGVNARAFDDDDIMLARSLADHAALAVANARLLTKEKELAARLRLLSELAQEFAACVSDYPALLQLVARRLGEVIGDGCSIRMISDDGRSLVTRGAVHHSDPDLLAYLEAAMTAQPQQLGEGVTGRVAATGKTALIPHVDLDQIEKQLGPRYREIVERAGIKSILVVALRAHDTIIGACAMYRTSSPEPFTEDDRYLLEDLATHAALAIENSRLLEASQREAEERIRTQEVSRLKSEFLANMSHELRTPLNAVIGFASLMHSGKAGALTEVHKEYIGDILNSARHLLVLINDVLDLAKIESGRQELRIEETDLARLASEVRDIVRGLAADRSIGLAIDLDPTLTHARVDPRLLKQVLYNYLSNAIKFTPEHGRVVLRIRSESDATFRIEVEDTGIGIRPADLGRLFVEFQQLDQGPTKRYPGTGLGLALTKRLVEAQGGTVEVRSEVGRGTVFSAVLPRNVVDRSAMVNGP